MAASEEGCFRVWSPSSKPSANLLMGIDEMEPYVLQRTTSGTSTQAPEMDDGKMERSISETSATVRDDGGHSSGDDFRDGPSLTPDGRAVDLDAGAPLFFAYDKLSSPGHERKCSAKENARQRRQRREASLRGSVAAEEVCSLDASGAVHGEDAMSPPLSGDGDGRAARLKLFHRKLRARRGQGEACWPSVCVDEQGRAMVYLDLASDRKRRDHVLRKRAAQRSDARCHTGSPVAAIDESGRLRRPRYSDFAHYLFTLAPQPQAEEPAVVEMEMERPPAKA